MFERALPESMFVIESDGRYDLGSLPQPGAWRIHSYPPAVLAVARK
jgi:hypothetical protein